MNFNDIVLLSSYIPTDAELPFAGRTLDYLVHWFKDAEFIIPINPPVNPRWLHLLKEKGISYTALEVPAELVVDSDASSCLHGLHYMREWGLTCQRLWIGHTKSVTTKHYGFIDLVGSQFWAKRFVIQDLMDRYPRIGGMSPIGGLSNVGPCKHLEGRCSGTYPANSMMALHSFMVLNGGLVDQFIKSLETQFFESNLCSIQPFDRYFVEREFSTVPSLYGRALIPMILLDHFGRPSTEETLNEEFQEWGAANNITDLPVLAYNERALDIKRTIFQPSNCVSA